MFGWKLDLHHKRESIGKSRAGKFSGFSPMMVRIHEMAHLEGLVSAIAGVLRQ